MHIQETTFKREEKDIAIGEIGVLDWASFKDCVIHETKKGKTPRKGDIAQVRYYMWWLNENGVKIREAQIHYPKMRKTKTVPWNDEAGKQVVKDATDCREIINKSQPPEIIEYPYCKSCAYFELCHA